jgi:hypothetical protein
MAWQPQYNVSFMARVQPKMRAVLLLALLGTGLASYCGAYFLMQRTAQTGTNAAGVFTVRYYSADWHAVLFQPAAFIESVVRDRDIQVEYTP